MLATDITPEVQPIPTSSVTANLIDEHELVDRIKLGDREAFRKLYDKYARLVYRYIQVRLHNAQDVEDLTSETFIKAWQGISSFQWRDTSIGAWLFRIAHNLIIDKYRKKRDVLGWLPWREGYEESKFSQAEDRDVIKRAFATLSYEGQVILYLHFFEGYSPEEIGKFLGKAPNAIRVAQFRALKHLRHVLGNERLSISGKAV